MQDHDDRPDTMQEYCLIEGPYSKTRRYPVEEEVKVLLILRWVKSLLFDAFEQANFREPPDNTVAEDAISRDKRDIPAMGQFQIQAVRQGMAKRYRKATGFPYQRFVGHQFQNSLFQERKPTRIE